MFRSRDVIHGPCPAHALPQPAPVGWHRPLPDVVSTEVGVVGFATSPQRSAPPQVLGVTNLRGLTVPIVNLRCSFGLQAASRSTSKP